MQYFGVDLAWGVGSAARPANESGLVVIDERGVVIDAGWARGVDEVAEWITERMAGGAVVAADGPLVVHNAPRIMRECEREVGRRYGRWGFSAYPSHPGLGWLSGVALRERLESAGIAYTDGTRVSAADELVMFECYPSTTIVGMPELGYDERKPRYKGRDPKLSPAESRVTRAAICDELIQRVATLRDADPPVDLMSHPVTAALVSEPSPLSDRVYKHREDLLDAVLCAWTASIWHRHGEARTLILGRDSEPDESGRRATIVAPARAEHRAVMPAGR
ncbi:DUF429 domain-containing protein [Herbiconiux sp. L3-i23]|uniref:DUF429 domain-containing protein n=1 Tax=Herbiconiux sp. L3-i23 TaxID=2905871 RepID=UPI0020735180|nr:DUF429 domain-containing protein [Herbiconiux sp. L3-i23]